jgi:hypothetical protein
MLKGPLSGGGEFERMIEAVIASEREIGLPEKQNSPLAPPP